MVSHVGRSDVVVALVFASQNQSTIRVDLDHTEALSVGHAQVGVVGSSHHGVTSEDVQSIASGGRVVICFEVASSTTLGLDVRIKGRSLVIGGHGDRDAAASCNICLDRLGQGVPSHWRTVVGECFATGGTQAID